MASSKMSFQIRYAKSSDISQLVQLCQDHAAYEGAEFDTTGKEEKLEQLIFNYDSQVKCLVVEMEGLLIGYATFMKQISTWDANFYVYMDCLYLKPEARGGGIGKLLMDEITDYARTEGCNLVQWQTPKENEGAIRFYQRLGANHKSKERFFLSL